MSTKWILADAIEVTLTAAQITAQTVVTLVAAQPGYVIVPVFQASGYKHGGTNFSNTSTLTFNIGSASVGTSSALPLNGQNDAVTFGPFAALEGLSSALVGSALTVNSTTGVTTGNGTVEVSLKYYLFKID
jgi:hypothetical protein